MYVYILTYYSYIYILYFKHDYQIIILLYCIVSAFGNGKHLFMISYIINCVLHKVLIFII